MCTSEPVRWGRGAGPRERTRCDALGRGQSPLSLRGGAEKRKALDLATEGPQAGTEQNYFLLLASSFAFICSFTFSTTWRGHGA